MRRQWRIRRNRRPGRRVCPCVEVYLSHDGRRRDVLKLILCGSVCRFVGVPEESPAAGLGFRYNLSCNRRRPNSGIQIEHQVRDSRRSRRIRQRLHRRSVRHVGLVSHGMRGLAEVVQQAVAGRPIVASSVHKAVVIVHNDDIFINQPLVAGTRLLHGQETTRGRANLSQGSDMAPVLVCQAEPAPTADLRDLIYRAPDIGLNGP